MKQRLASLLGALVLLTGAVMIGCKQQSPTPTYKITLNVSENGTVEVNPKLPKDGKVPQYTVLTFTATPEDAYEVEWAGAAPDAGDKNKATLTVTADATVSATFKKRGDTVKENKEKIADVSLLKINVRGEIVGVTDKNALEGKLTIPDTVRSIKDQALDGCICLTDVIIPQSVISIGGGAFAGCVRLTHINIPDGVHDIGRGAFSYCVDLVRVSIGKGLSEFEASVFENCPRLSSITVDPENETYCSENNIVYSKDKTYLVLVAPAGVTDSFTIPDGIVSIGSDAFSNCTNLTSVTLPASLNDFDGSAFEGCSRLSAITLDSSNPFYCSIDNIVYKADKTKIVYAPEGLTGTVNIPDDLTYLEYPFFRKCAELTGIKIGSKINRIGNNVFSDCEKLREITIDPGNPSYCSIDNIIYKADKKEIVYVPKGLAGTVTLPNELLGINEKDFHNRMELTDVTIGTDVKKIGMQAFEDCSSLETVTIKSSSLTTIDWGAFNNIKDGAQFTVKTDAVKTLLQNRCNIPEANITVD